ncbi:MAG: hypothetical protein ABFD97_00425 [Syntrophobacter sp.]
MTNHLNREVGTLEYDKLIAGVNPPIHVNSGTIRQLAVAATYPRGTVLAKSSADNKLVILGTTDEAPVPASILGTSTITPAAVAGLHADTKLSVNVNGNAFEMSNAGLKALPIAVAVAKPAVVLGSANINNAAAAGAHADTVITITVNGKAYVVANATLAALAADSTDSIIMAALASAVAADGVNVQAVAEFALVGSKIQISTRDVGASQSIAIAGTWGAAADEALFEGIFGFAFPVAAVAGAASAAEQIAQAIADLALTSGLKVSDLADVLVAAGKLRIVTKDSGTNASLAITGAWGAAGDEATIEGILGVSLPAVATTDENLTPDCILCDDTAIGTAADVVAAVYTAGCFSIAALTIKDGYTMTEGDKDKLRERGIYLGTVLS